MIGRTLGNYRLVEQIGLGGMATVYKAYDPDTDRYVAIKVLPQYFSQDPTFRERFQREAKAIAKLEHLHILPIFAYGEDEGTAYMAMRYLQAGTLTDRIRQGPLPLSEASRLLNQIASALDHAHTYGVLHRDIKPSNVLLDANGNAFLTDFGIAKMVEATLDLTGGGILGTPAYMSPEQCRGNTELTPASDQYSLGIVLYEMITGRAPFWAETPIALIHMQLNDPLPLPRQLRPGLPQDAERVILKALAKEPGSRYQSCGAMASAFAQAVAQASPEQPVARTPAALPVDDATMPHAPAGPTRAAPPPGRRLPAWVFGLIALLVVGGLIAAALAVGLFSFERVTIESQQTAEPAVAVGPTPTSKRVKTPEPAAPAPGASPLATTSPPTDLVLETSWVRPCDWEGLGPGLCISPLEGGRPRKILTDAEIEITSSASWSPDGQQIVFSAVEPGESHAGDQTIRIVNADGTGLVELPQFNNDVGPVWSPNGEWLAFHSSGNLAIMHPDGSEPTLLWEGKDNQCAVEPQWSPDSQALVVSILHGGCGWSLPVTREIWVIADAGNTIIPLATVTHKNEDCTEAEAAFSPDGQQVAYFDGNCRPWLVNVDGSGQATPLDDFPYGWKGMVHPQWGLEGVSEAASPPAAEPLPEARIVELCEGTKPPQICVRDASSDRVIQITDDLKFETIYRLAWSPDGEQIVFDAGSSDETKIYDHKLYLINADGSDLRQITYGENNDIDPAWSPDGEWIAFHRSCQLWVLAAHSDAPDERLLLENREDFCASGPVWSPDSRRIAFVNHPGQGFPIQIQTITPDGADQQLIFTFEPPVDWADLAWNPDGRQLACWYGVGDEARAFLLDADGNSDPKPIDPDEKLPRWWRAEFWVKAPGQEADQDSREERCGPEEEVLFVDDFEDGQAEGWNFLSEKGVQQSPWPVGVDEGNHFLVGTGHNWAQTGPDSWTDYNLHVRFRHVTADSDAHLNVRVGDGRYHVHLRGGLLKRDFPPKGERDVMLARWDYQPDREWHEFTLSAVGERIEAYLDGKLVGAYDDPDPLPPGRIGLENLAGTTWYDEVVVCGR